MKKIISLCLVLMMILTGTSFAASGDSEYQRGYEEGLNAGYREGYNDGSDSVYRPKEPNIIFVEPKAIPEVEAGDILNLVVELKNDSQYSAKEVRLIPSFDEAPIVYERPVSQLVSGTIRAKGTKTVSFAFKVKDDAKMGVYSIPFKVEYKNGSDETYSKDRVAYFRVTKTKMQSTITINKISTEPNVVAGEKFVLKFNVNNVGDVPAQNTSIKLNRFDVGSFIPVDGNDYQYIGDLDAKSTSTQYFELLASKNIPKGTNTIGATVTYTNSNGEEVNEEKTIYILNVLSEKESLDTGNGKPKVIIASYSTNPGSIVAGNQFNFTFNFKNTSKEKTVTNMKITVSSAEGSFMIANGSNTFYIDSLAAGASMSKTIALNVKQDLTSKSYPIEISFDYEDTNGNSYVATEVINIPVTEYSKLVINSVWAGEGIINERTNMSFDYINMGKARVSNLTASVAGDYTSVQEINYIGNLEAGSSDYFDIEVTPTKEGENVGTLILAFEDSSGKTIEVKKEFTGFAMGAFVDPGFEDPGMYDPMPMEPVEEPLNWWLVVGFGVGGFVVAFFVTKIIVTKIIRKKLEEEI